MATEKPAPIRGTNSLHEAKDSLSARCIVARHKKVTTSDSKNKPYNYSAKLKAQCFRCSGCTVALDNQDPDTIAHPYKGTEHSHCHKPQTNPGTHTQLNCVNTQLTHDFVAFRSEVSFLIFFFRGTLFVRFYKEFCLVIAGRDVFDCSFVL